MGCGIGGPARFLAQQGCHVTGVDLTPDFVSLARELNARCGLADRIEIRQADATALPFADGTFDVAWTQHVVMNIADKAAFYGEARRVLRPGGRLALFDVVAGDGRTIHLPVPWASSADQNFLLPAGDVAALVEQAGFSISVWDDATDELLPAVAAVARAAAGDGPLLTPALYVPDAATRFARTHRNLEEGRIRLLYGVAQGV
jgi:SAM-dependent methyltransferase